MNVLGISCFYHDSAACLVRDGKIIAAVQEERFTRKKFDLGFPDNAIEYCLKEGGIKFEDVDVIAFYEKPFLKFERLLYQFIQTFPLSLKAFLKSIPPWLSERLLVPSIIREKGFKGKLFFMEHHLSHAASTFLPSGFDKAAILTVDGVGEFATTTMGVGNGTDIKILKELQFPHSIGLLYSTATAFLGFKVNNGEYKVMGLSALGKPKYVNEIKKMIDLKKDGSFALNMDYFDFHKKMTMPSKKWEELFGPARKVDAPLTQRDKDLSASLQKVTEEAYFNLINALYDLTGEENLCIAGGVGLNSLANGMILNKSRFKSVWIQPAAGDAGTCLGAALYAYHTLLGNKNRQKMETAFLGPGYSNQEIEKFLKTNKIKYSKFASRSDLLKKTAKMIYEDNVIGWFQGRMEWGPRALGSRSILSNAANPDMKDILNQKVKHREHFRPFAPVITLEDTLKWFEADKPVPEPTYYMLMVYPIVEKQRKKIPAVTHIDGTGRLQVIKREQNSLYYDLIKEFEKLSKVPILINTSFNIRGEPIVCKPENAYRCMMGTGIDAAVMGNFLVKRKDNPKDMWDSEKVAKD